MSIKSVNIRSTDIKRRLLMSSASIDVFEVFLKETIGDEVLVVNTNIGMEVYYYSENDYSNFIKENIVSYILKGLDRSKLKFRSNLNRETVYQSFCESLMTFAQYPQLFLAYSKKFIHIKRRNESSIHVIPILSGFFEEVLKVLSKTNKMPHYEKIKKVRSDIQKPDPEKNVIKDLISEILMKEHYN